MPLICPAVPAVAIPISFIGANTTDTGGSVTIPAHAVDDIIIIAAFATAASSITKPAASGTVPAWVDIDVPAAANSSNIRTAYFKATATNHTSGTWTNSGVRAAIVLRAQRGTTPIGGHATSTGAFVANTTTAPAVTLTVSDGSSFLLHIHFHNLVTSFSAVPGGYTRRAKLIGTSAGVCVNSKDSTTTDGAIAQAGSTTLSASWKTTTIEILRA